MFTFSFDWLNRISQYDLALDEVVDILNLQGFDVKGVDGSNITIEVKANRPDALNHMGILREIHAYKGFLEPKLHIPISHEQFSKQIGMNIEIHDNKAVRRYSLIKISGINLSKSTTPKYIQHSLQSLGINIINPVVDIINYSMLDSGQPMHAYDLNKVSQKTIKVHKLASSVNLDTLDQTNKNIPSGTIVISDDKKVLAVGGIIGADNCCVDNNTCSILLESASFDEIDIRLTSRKLRLSTPSSFRFERGVDMSSSLDKALICANMIVDICGGNIEGIYDYYPNAIPTHIIALKLAHVQKILGIDLDKYQIQHCLDKYYFQNELIKPDIIKVTCPNYRLDLFEEVDIIEEIARIYGYHNIPHNIPTCAAPYISNPNWEKSNILREILVGLNFCEAINYSFVPENTINLLGLSIDDNSKYVSIKNPLSSQHSLMRPVLIYSLMDNIAYNHSRGTTNLALFEIGRTYVHDNSFDTKVKESDTIGIIFTGTRIEKGWGIPKDIKYNYYDIANYIDIVFKELGVEYELEYQEQPFFMQSTGLKVCVNQEDVGFCGQISKDILGKIINGKLIKNDVFYIELLIGFLSKNIKSVKKYYKYPRINREYNFLIDKSTTSSSIVSIIKNTSYLVENIIIKDLYNGKGVPSDKNSVLLNVTFGSESRTLNSDEISQIELEFLDILSKKLKVELKA